MARTNDKWYLGGEELVTNPPVRPANGVWMEIDYSKLSPRRGQPGRDDPRFTSKAQLKARIAEFEGAMAKIEMLVTNQSRELRSDDEIIGQIRRIVKRVSD